jgi:O-methyltransferase
MDALLNYAKRIAYSSEETLMFTYEIAKKFANSPGCYVECGVAAGAQIIAMRAGAPNKIIHAFDSFQGIPLPSNRDDQMPGIKYLTREEILLLPCPDNQELKSTGMTSVSIDDFNNHMVQSGAGLNNLVTHPGWFQDTTAGYPKSHNMEMSLFRLDGDLYQSTFVCLQNLWHLVLRGGCVIIDDWELTGSRAACIDFFGAINYNPKYQFISNIAYFYK